ncbi:MAG: hypothetical protein QW331_00360 [Candidatus Woesearchaeota archaeon]
MKNTYWLALMVLIFSIFALSVNATSNQVGTFVNITNFTTTAPQLNLSQSHVGNFTVQFINQSGNGTGTISFSSTTFTGLKLKTNLSGIISFNASSLLFLANRSAFITYTITVPSSASSAFADNYTGFINATFNATNWDFFRVNFTVNAQPSLTATNPSATAVQGQSGTGTFTITNTGNTDLSLVNFTLGPFTSGSNTLSAVSLNFTNSTTVPFGQSSSILATISPSTSQATGTYSGPITFIFDGRQLNATLSATISAAASTVSVSGSGPTLVRNTTKNVGNLTITVSNTGNTNLSSLTVNILAPTSGSTSLGTSIFSASSYSISSLPTGSSHINNITTTIGSTTAAGTYTGILNVTFTNSTGGSTFTSGSYSIVVKDPTTSLTVPSLEFTAKQTDRNSTIKKNITVINAGDTTLTLLTVNSTVSNLSFSSFNDTSLLPGENAFTTASLFISSSQNTGKVTLGSYNVFSDLISNSATVTLNLESKLKIIDIRAKVEGASDNNLKDGDTIQDEATTGDTVEFVVEIENQYSASENIDIKDVDVEVTIEDIDDGRDMNEEERNIDIRADDSETLTFTFELPEDPKDLDEGDYDVVITAEGKDEKGIIQSDKATLTLEVKKEEDDLRINLFVINPNPLSCDRNLIATVTVTNFGSNDQDDTLVTIGSSELNLEQSYVVDLNEEERDSRSFSFAIPQGIAVKAYPFTASVYYDGGRVGKTDLGDSETIQLNVQECKPEATTKTTTETTTESITTQQAAFVQGIVATGIAPRQTVKAVEEPVEEKTPFTETTTYLLLLGGGVVVTVLLLIGLMIIMFI